MKRLLLVVVLFSLPFQLAAQQGSTGGIQFISPLQIAAGKDNNFLVDRTDPNEKLFVLSLPPSVQPGTASIGPKLLRDEFFLLRLPTIGFVHDSRRHELAATWMPEFEVYFHNKDLNAMNQEAVVGFNYFLSSKTQISVGDAYRSSNDPARTIQNVFLLLPLGPYRENAIRAIFDYQPNQLTSLSVRFDHNYTKFGNTDPFQVRILNSQSTGYTFAAARMLARNQRLRGTYSIFTRRPINNAAVNDDAVDTGNLFEQTTHAANLQYKVGLNPGTIVAVSGGVIRLETGFNYTFQGTIDKRLATFYWLGASYARSLSYLSATPTGFAPGLASNGFYDMIFFRFSGQPTLKTSVLLNATLARSASSRIVESNEALLGRARFDYRLSDRKVLFTSLETYQQNRNLYVQSPLARNRFTVGVEISLASDVQRRTSKLNQDGRYVALTEHARRRNDPGQED